jgi:hypothetical protein
VGRKADALSAMRRIDFFYVVYVVDGSTIATTTASATTTLTCARTLVACDVWITYGRPRVSGRFICEHVHGIVLQNRAAHETQSSFVRQVAREPQPPIELRVVQFS